MRSHRGIVGQEADEPSIWLGCKAKAPSDPILRGGELPAEARRLGPAPSRADYVGAMDLILFEGDDEGPTRAEEVDSIRRGDSLMTDIAAAEMLVDSVSGVMVSVATGGPGLRAVMAVRCSRGLAKTELDTACRLRSKTASRLGRLGCSAYPR